MHGRHHEAQAFSTTALPAQRRERELAILIEPLEREVRRLRALTAAGGCGEVSALLGDERPDEQQEEERDEADGDALRDEPAPVRHGSPLTSRR